MTVYDLSEAVDALKDEGVIDALQETHNEEDK